MRRHIALGVLLGLVASPVLAQTLPYYVTDGDSNIAYIIQNGVLQDTFPTGEVDIPYPPAVVNEVRIADRVNAAAAEYDFAGNFTGATFSGGPDFDEMLDGGTNGVDANYACQFGNAKGMGKGLLNNMVETDRNFENGVSIFTVDFDMTGCTYDTATNTLWVIDDSQPGVKGGGGGSSIIRQFSLTGSELASFDPGVSGRLCCLAYDFGNDSLWFLQNSLPGKTSGEMTGSGRGPAKGNGGDRTLFEYSKAGVRLDAFIVPGFDPSNPWGGEMPIPAKVIVPALSPWGITVLLMLFGVAVIVVMRRRARAH